MARKQSKSRRGYVLLITAVIAFLVCAGLYFYQANTTYNNLKEELLTDIGKLRDGSDKMLGELSYAELDEAQLMLWQNYLYSIVPRNQIAIVMGQGKEVLFSTASDIDELVNSLTGDGGQVKFNGLSFIWTSAPSKDSSLKYVLAMSGKSLEFLSQRNLPVVFLGSILLIIIGVNLVVIASGKLRYLDDSENDYLYQHELASEETDVADEAEEIDYEALIEKEEKASYILPQAKPINQEAYDSGLEDEAIKETMASAATVVNSELRKNKQKSTVEPKEMEAYKAQIPKDDDEGLVDINIDAFMPKKEASDEVKNDEKVEMPQRSVSQADVILSGIEAARQKSKAESEAGKTKTVSKTPAKSTAAKSKKNDEKAEDIEITLDSKAKRIPSEVKKMIKESKGRITLTECADKLGVHHTYIWKVLKMVDDRSFQDYLEEYRLGEAKRMLLETNMTVQQIADELGYTNAQNFIRFFSKVTGVTPGKFKKGIE